jgi:NAD(P)-dependent dehydrogenase (short-subunit alcohol dehydrogenase family)
MPVQKPEAALALCNAEVPDAPVEIMDLDLASLASVQRFAEVSRAKYDRLDLLIDNAGIMMVPTGGQGTASRNSLEPIIWAISGRPGLILACLT